MSRSAGLLVALILASALLAGAGLAGCASEPSVDRANAAEATANIGAEHLRRGDNDRAQTAFKRALSYDADNFTANWGMAVISDRANAVHSAQRYFEHALAVRDVPAVYNSYAAFLCRHDQSERGIEMFGRALASDNAVDRADILANAGLCLARANKRERATDYFRRALEANADQPTALTQMAKIAYHERDYMRARAFIERADSATPLAPDQLRLAARIEKALGDPAAASAYMTRYNDAVSAAPRSSSELEQARP